jgi:hypothetical protein
MASTLLSFASTIATGLPPVSTNVSSPDRTSPVVGLGSCGAKTMGTVTLFPSANSSGNVKPGASVKSGEEITGSMLIGCVPGFVVVTFSTGLVVPTGVSRKRTLRRLVLTREE